jgi:ankyrin repeat protein
MITRGMFLLAGLVTGLVVATASAQDPQSRLWDAAMAGDTVGIVQALDAGARVDSLDVRSNPNGRRALNWAAYNDRGPAVRLLIARGASLNLANNTGFTPVHHAAEAGSAEAMKILLEAGADITIPNIRGNLPLDTARSQGHGNVVQLLEAAMKKP